MNITSGSSFSHRTNTAQEPRQRKVENLTQPAAVQKLDAHPDQFAQLQTAGSIKGNRHDSINREERDQQDNSPDNLITDADRREIDALARRDREVRAHEAAHLAAAGNLAKGGASYEYKTGPDGKRYAVGGEVEIDTSKPDSPEAALIKAQRIRAAALAPSKPSAQDRSAAATASQLAAEARAEIAQQKLQEQRDQLEQAESNSETQSQSGQVQDAISQTSSNASGALNKTNDKSAANELKPDAAPNNVNEQVNAGQAATVNSKAGQYETVFLASDQSGRIFDLIA